jgi:hypothetical protein
MSSLLFEKEINVSSNYTSAPAINTAAVPIAQEQHLNLHPERNNNYISSHTRSRIAAPSTTFWLQLNIQLPQLEIFFIYNYTSTTATTKAASVLQKLKIHLLLHRQEIFFSFNCTPTAASTTGESTTHQLLRHQVEANFSSNYSNLLRNRKEVDMGHEISHSILTAAVSMILLLQHFLHLYHVARHIVYNYTSSTATNISPSFNQIHLGLQLFQIIEFSYQYTSPIVGSNYAASATHLLQLNIQLLQIRTNLSYNYTSTTAVNTAVSRTQQVELNVMLYEREINFCFSYTSSAATPAAASTSSQTV